MRVEKLVVALAVTAIASTIVACGSDEGSLQDKSAPVASVAPRDSDPPEGKSPPAERPDSKGSDHQGERARFIRKADALCAAVLEKVAGMPLPADLSAAIAAIEKGTSLNEKLTSDLRRITPDRFSTTMNLLYERVDALVSLTHQSLLPAMRAQDPATTQSVARQIVKETRAVNSKMRKFGFDACSRSH